MSDKTLKDQLKSAGRELGIRRAKYPKLVESGKMSSSEVAHEIACMEAIYATLKNLVAAELQAPAGAEPTTPEEAAALVGSQSGVTDAATGAKVDL